MQTLVNISIILVSLLLMLSGAYYLYSGYIIRKRKNLPEYISKSTTAWNIQIVQLVELRGIQNAGFSLIVQGIFFLLISIAIWVFIILR